MLRECVCGCAADRCTCSAALTSTRVHPSRLALSPASSQSVALSPAPRPPPRHFLSCLADSEALSRIVRLRWVNQQAVDWPLERRRRTRKEGRDHRSGLPCSVQTDWRTRRHMLFCICESCRCSQIVLPVRKTITFRHRFLSELDLQLYSSLNNLPLLSSFFLLLSPHPFSCLPISPLPTAVQLSFLQVAGIKGVFLSNKVVENQVRTYITYNKGRDWRLLRAPTTDLQGNKFYCEQVSSLAGFLEINE